MTEEQKAEVAYFASLHFTREEIALVTGADPRDPEFTRILKTEYLRREAKVRESIFELAEQGSGPAQAAALKIIETKRLREA